MFAEVFTDCRQLPSEKELHRALDSAFGAWKKLVGIIKRRFPEARQQWKYYNTTRGWVMIIRNHSHTLLYLAPGRGSFSITILLSEDVVRKHDHVFFGKIQGVVPPDAEISTGLPAEAGNNQGVRYRRGGSHHRWWSSGLRGIKITLAEKVKRAAVLHLVKLLYLKHALKGSNYF
jgi:hypothetical protein